MKLLITGGAGFIGSNFILYWQKNYPQDHIINLDKLTYAGNLDNLSTISSNNNYRFVKGDICNKQLVDEIMKQVDTVVHFAAESHVDRSIKDPSLFVRTNVFGTYNLLEKSLKNNIKRFHHISTDEVYGSLNLNEKIKFSENSAYYPRSPYAASKSSSDHLVRAYFHTYGLPVTISNCSNNYGPYQYPEKFIPLAITNVLENKKIPVYGDGLYIRDWLYVEDHCKAIDMILKNGKIGTTYNIGGLTNDVTNLQIIEEILKIMGKSDNWIEFVKDRPGHDRKYAVDWTKINQELGWKPEHDFNYWLKATVSWYEKNRKWWKKLKKGKFLKFYKDQYNS